MSTKHPNRGNYYERTQWNSLEKAFADQWEKENEGRASINGGMGLLDCLLRTEKKEDEFWAEGVSARQRHAAATVVQWLGTNIGFSFLRESLARCGYKVVGGQPNRDHFFTQQDEPMLAAVERKQWEDHCDNFVSKTQAELAQEFFDRAEPH